MEKILEILSNQGVIIGLAAVIILLVSWFIIRKIISKNLKKKMSEAEIRYNSIKSVPLPFKLNKAVAIARVNQEVMQSVTSCKDDFEEVQTNLKDIAQLLADTEDFLLIGKHKKVREGLVDLDSMLLLGEKQVKEMDEFLDTILEKETAQRQEITALKDKFRNLKALANEQSSSLSFSWEKIEEEITSNEKMFSAFEEWMYASDFEKSSQQLVEIRDNIQQLDELIHTLPDLLQVARGLLPRLIDEVARNHVTQQKSGVSLEHLGIEKELLAITEALEVDLAQLKGGSSVDVKEHLDSYRQQLVDLNNKILNEGSAHEEVKKIMAEIVEVDRKTQNHLQKLKELSEIVMERFGFNDLEEKLIEAEEEIQKLAERKNKIFDDINQTRLSSVDTLKELQNLQEEYVTYQGELQKSQDKMDQARGDEARAKKQLLKLQLIMNEMQVKTRKHRLPAISSTYEEDLVRAYEYIHSLVNLIDETPLNVQLLNATLKDAIDFIYKLYNNVNNVVGMAVMVENTIVFGNKYRSSYPEIDSELTRAELCFRNGEYTQALTIAISTIEKIHPGQYESLIRENAKSGA